MKALFTIMILFVAATNARAADKPVIHHDVTIHFDLDQHEIHISDVLTVPAGIDSLMCNSSLIVAEYVKPGGNFRFDVTMPDAGPPAEELYAVDVRGSSPADDSVATRYDFVARFLETTDNITFSRENVGREIQATISEEGIYLAAEGWLPFHPDALATHHLTIHTPLEWEPVTQGRRVRHEVVGDELVTVWEATKPADGLILIANRYQVTERQFGDVTSYTYFLDDDEKLVETYQERTGAYLAMYDEMIGPYPYAKFATVENWFPTGYGMPSWTLLGGTVLRLPFIPTTSFGHEIAHNWWGNSAFVDDTGGNWCEGLTVYCADYHYKELESAAAAHEYRRNLLKDFAAYVHDDRDMSLREFKARHSGATRAIGYGKSMMVFHMVERSIGREAFLAALRDVWGSHPFQQLSWDDFFAAFSNHGGVDLSWMRDQWLDRTGAPLLSIESVKHDGDKVDVVLTQEGPAWVLDIPVVIETRSGEREHVVRLEGLRGEFSFEAPGAVAVHIDPGDHVFRRLHPVEIEPTLSQVLGEESPGFLTATPAGREFATAWIEADDPVMLSYDAATMGKARIVVNPEAAELKRWLPDGAQTAGTMLFLNGTRIDLSKNIVTMAVTDPDQSDVTSLVVLCLNESQLPSLAGRLSHYGKYSWLVFPSRGRPQRGNWEISASPLSADLD